MFVAFAAPASRAQVGSPRQIPGQLKQSTAGVIGRVLHVVPTASGAAERVSLPAAAIEIINLATGKINKTAADAEGIFRIRGLAPGNYQVSAALPGYQPLFVLVCS